MFSKTSVQNIRPSIHSEMVTTTVMYDPRGGERRGNQT
jgi:hypothetical protein